MGSDAPSRFSIAEVNDTNQTGVADSDLNLARISNELMVAQQNSADPPFLPRYDYYQNVLRAEFEEGLDRVRQIPTAENPANHIRPGDVLKVVRPDGRTEFFDVMADGRVFDGRTRMSLQQMLQINSGSTIFRRPASSIG